MKLFEEFKLYETMWDNTDDYENTSDLSADTTSFEISVENSSKTLKCSGLSYRVALSKIIAFINKLSNAEKEKVVLYWHYDQEGNDIINLYPLSHFVDLGEPAEAYSEIVDRYDNVCADDFTETQLLKALDVMPEPAYIIAPNGNAGGNIYHMGYDLKTAQKEFRKIARDFVKYGMGGGDTAIELYEYTGDLNFFEEIYNKWKANVDNTYFDINIEELGFDFADCETLKSVDG